MKDEERKALLESVGLEFDPQPEEIVQEPATIEQGGVRIMVEGTLVTATLGSEVTPVAEKRISYDICGTHAFTSTFKGAFCPWCAQESRRGTYNRQKSGEYDSSCEQPGLPLGTKTVAE